MHSCLALLLACGLCLFGFPALAADNTVAIEALSRLKGMDLEANPALKAAVLRVVESTRGTPQFVELVRDFKLQGQEQALLDYALSHASESAGTEAMRLLLAQADLSKLSEALKGAKAAELVEVLGNSNDRRSLPFLEGVLLDNSKALPLRDRATRALSKSHDGAALLIRHAGAGSLPADLKAVAGDELQRARWPEIQEQATRLLRPAAPSRAPLPPLNELIARRGDRARGEAVFFSEKVNCAGCHQVGSRGKDYGPRLTEIGVKLGKDALYTAILDPNAGISFGFETWQLEFKDGEEASGLIASETEEEIALKAPGGIVTRYKKSTLSKRQKLKTSTMPSGLEQAMTVQELVDLVEYVSGLGKPQP